MNLLLAVHQLAWTQHPAIWLCESCAILWLMLRAVRSPWVRAGVLLVLCGLILNGIVTAVNAGTMPVVGMPSTLHPVSTMWRAATSETQLPFLADQARLGMFSVGDLVMLFGGILIIVAICLHRALRMEGRLICKRLGWILQEPTGHVTFQCPTPAGRRTAVKHGVTRRVCKIGEDDGIQKIVVKDLGIKEVLLIGKISSKRRYVMTVKKSWPEIKGVCCHGVNSGLWNLIEIFR